MKTTLLHVDLSAGGGRLWIKAPQPAADGTIICARHISDEADLDALRAERFCHVAFAPSGDRFAAVDIRGAVFIFHLRANRFSLVHWAGKDVSAICFRPGRDHDLILALASRTLRVISTDTGDVKADLKAHRSIVTCVDPHPSGRYLVSCAGDGAILWDLKTYRRMRHIGAPAPPGGVAIQAAFMHSGSTLITLSRHEGLSLFHFPTLDLRAKLLPPPSGAPGARLTFRSFALTPNRMHLVAATADCTAFVWHLPSETVVEELQLPAAVFPRGAALKAPLPEPTTALPDGAEVAALGVDGVLRLLAMPRGEVAAALGTACYAFAVHGGRAVTCGADGSLRLVELSAARAACAGGAAPPAAAPPRGLGAGGKGQPAPACRRPLAPAQQPRAPAPEGGGGGALAAIGGRECWEEEVEPTRVGGAPRGTAAAPRAPALGLLGGGEWGDRVERLRAFLDVHDEFPAAHRANVWRHVLLLPRNEAAYKALVAMGPHKLAQQQLEAHAVATDSRAKLRLGRVASALGHWCDALAASDFLPAFAHPWVSFFGRDEVLATEACVMFALNWARGWFQYWPSPPLQALGAVDRVLFAQDPALSKALHLAGASSKEYAWPLLRTMFSEVLDHASWVRLMDHVLVSPPERILLFIAAFLNHQRAALLCVTEPEQLRAYLAKARHVEVPAVVAIARKMAASARLRPVLLQVGLADLPPLALQPVQFLGSSADGGAYPLLTDFPKAAVEHHVAQ